MIFTLIVFALADTVCPDKFDFTDMTSISDRQYQSCSKTEGKNLVIPESIKSIGLRAFEGCSGIEGTLTINAKITEISASCFEECNKITEIILPQTIQTIGSSSFGSCSHLTKINFPTNLITIDDGAFYECNKLAISIEFPSKLNKIGEEAFYRCNELSGKLTIGASIKEIGNAAFAYCSNIRQLDISNCYNFESTGVFEGCSGLKGQIEIPEWWEFISALTFSKCSNISQIVITKDIKQIKFGAFYCCTSLKGTLSFPDSIETVGSYVFYNCSQLEKFENFAKIKSIGEYAFCNCFSINGVVAFNEEITVIPLNLFYGCINLVGPLTLPEGIEYIECGAFYNCQKLILDKDVLNLEGLGDIQKDIFYNCKNLKGSLVLPNVLSFIDSNAFYNCSQLTGSVTIENTYNTPIIIKEYSFYGCSGFKGKLILDRNVMLIGKEAFGLTNFSHIIYKNYIEPICPDPIGNNLKVVVPKLYQSEKFCGCRLLKDIPAIDRYSMQNKYVISDINQYNYINKQDGLDSEYLKVILDSNTNDDYYYFYNFGRDYFKLNYDNVMSPNQFFVDINHDSGSAQIKYYSGDLNFYDPRNVEFDITQNDEVDISIVGSGIIFLNGRYGDHEIRRDFIIDGELDINIEGNLLFEKVTLMNKGNLSIHIDNYASVAIKELNVESYTDAIINIANITETLIIKHSASITLSNANLSNADIVYQMGSYFNDENLIKGDLSSIPKSFTIIEPEEPKMQLEKEYILIDGFFDCKKWNAKLDENSTKYFEKVVCELKSNSNILANDGVDYYQLKLIRKDDIPPITDDFPTNDENNNDNDSENNSGSKNDSNKLGIGAIVGIVVGCVVVVAALMIAEYFIIKKCAKRKDTSEKEGNEEI